MRYWSPLGAHAAWIARLREYIYGAGRMDAEIVTQDDECEIGRWIYGDGAQFGQLREYQDAREVHAAFHRRAARVVRMVERGHRLEAAADLAPGGELRRLSGALVSAFAKLNKKIVALDQRSVTA